MTVVAALLACGTAHAALQLEGNSGVFLNTLAGTLAQGKYEAATHYVDLNAAGTVSTFNLSAGLQNNIELGVTRLSTDVAGVSDQNIYLAKWNFGAENAQKPALSVWAQYRDLIDGANSTDYGVSATKTTTLLGYTTILDLGVRSTKAKGLGLFGYQADREYKLEGAVAFVATKNLVIGTEFKQMVDSRVWRDVCARYTLNSNLNIDAGYANMGPGFDSQLAFAVTYSK